MSIQLLRVHLTLELRNFNTFVMESLTITVANLPGAGYELGSKVAPEKSVTFE